jgi:hypothetical protein
VLFVTATGASVFGPVQPLLPVPSQAILGVTGPYDNIPAVASIAAIRSPLWYKLLSMESDNTITAIPGFHSNLRSVKHIKTTLYL